MHHVDVNSTIALAYDELGRLSGRTVAGAGVETFQYDAIGRLTGRTNDLGAFTIGYLGQTGQVTSRQLASSTLATTWSYLNNAGDRRLAGVANVGLTAGQFSTYAFTSTPEDFVASITETADTTAVYPSATTQTATYNTLNQLTNLSGQTLTYDAIGNLTSDGLRTYNWDAESRLVAIAYPGQLGKATAFTYDGLGRRTTIAETPPGGGAAVTTSYLWCDDALCQARDATNARTRSYYDEGEVEPGSPAQPYYYGVDQLGSVRRAFASTSSAPAYAYDPYGVPLQVTAPVTDFGYAGMFNHPASGLNLTLYRAYDPIAGRWLSRDPLGEPSDPAGNLYAYVGGDPISLIDPTGELFIPGAIGGAAGGFLGSVGGQLYNSGGNLSCVSLGQAGRDAVAGAAMGSAAGLLAGIFRRAAAALAGRAAAARTVGDLTRAETRAIQGVVDRAGRPLNVVGSAARGERRGVGTNLPVGKGPGTRSDIDYIAPPGSHPYFRGQEGRLPSLDSNTGIIPGSPNPNIGPSIRFEPGNSPRFIPGN